MGTNLWRSEPLECEYSPMRVVNLIFFQIYQATSSPSSFSSNSSKASSTSAPTSQPTIPSLSGYNYFGCYTEATNGRALNLASKTDKAMTLELCASYCTTLNYPMFGTEYSTEVCPLHFFTTTLTNPNHSATAEPTPAKAPSRPHQPTARCLVAAPAPRNAVAAVDFPLTLSATISRRQFLRCWRDICMRGAIQRPRQGVR
jgi:hypothetical protein